MKKEIVIWFGVTKFVHAQRVHRWEYQMEKPPRSKMHDLVHLTKKWLQPESLEGLKIVERVVMDHMV